MHIMDLLEHQRSALRAFRQAEAEAAQRRAQEQDRQERERQAAQERAQLQRDEASSHWEKAQKAGTLRQAAQDITGRYANCPAVSPSDVSGPVDTEAELNRAVRTVQEAAASLQRLIEELYTWREERHRQTQRLRAAITIAVLLTRLSRNQTGLASVATFAVY